MTTIKLNMLGNVVQTWAEKIQGYNQAKGGSISPSSPAAVGITGVQSFGPYASNFLVVIK